MVIRSRQWFYALTGSMLLHFLLLQSIPLYQLTPMVRQQVENPFTVLLADPEILEQLILEEPEVVQAETPVAAEPIPMVSLDESQQQFAEMMPSGVALEVTPGAELESESVEMEAQPELPEAATPELAAMPTAELSSPPPVTILKTPNTDGIKMPARIDHPLSSLPETEEIASPVVQSLVTERQDLNEPAPEPLTLEDVALPETEILLVESEEELLIAQLGTREEFSMDATDVAPLPELPELLPEISSEPEAILAEIQIEQIDFEALEMEMLPEVVAEEWRPSLPGAVAETKGDGSRVKSWRSRYSGATGISFGYRARMRVKLTGFTLYPKAVAEEQGIQGKVLIGFVIDRSGALVETEILQSSGHEVLDRAVEQMVEMAQPFEIFSDEVKSDKVGFAFPVTVKLKK